MKQQAALPPGSPRDKGRPRAVWNVFKQFGSAVVGLLIIAYPAPRATPAELKAFYFAAQPLRGRYRNGRAFSDDETVF